MLEREVRRLYMPDKCREVLAEPSRYKVLYGGRGSGKSWAYARRLAVEAAGRRIRVLCTREMQNSIRDSVYRLIVDQIVELGLEPYYQIFRESIISRAGSEFLFKGLRHNISEIKSTEGIDVCWVEEAERVSGDSWDTLIPTIREPRSEIWLSFNPEDENSATYTRFVKNPPPNCRSACVTFEDNEHFPEVLRQEMEYCRRTDKDKFEHVWLGLPKGYAADLIFKGKIRYEDFDEPDEDTQFYYGADFGFSVDPTVLNRMFIKERDHDESCGVGTCERKHPILYIDYEAYGHGVEIEQLPDFFKSVPGALRRPIYADAARPDTISFLANKGFTITAADKGKDSVIDGIEFLRSFEAIVIHKRCPGSYGDYMNYRFKRDKMTEKVLPIPLDTSNHSPDATRYALYEYIKSTTTIWDVMR